MKAVMAVLFLMAPSIACAAPPLPEPTTLPALTGPQSDYVEHCSGCHGMQGNSAPAEFRCCATGWCYFMCTGGREYLIRLPNVAYSAITDNQGLADMMNFVVFGLGGNSAPKRASPYLRKWVGKRALATQSLIARAQVVE
jgi:hypothetical protein